MTTITHVCAGYLISRYAFSLGLISPELLPAVTTVSILAANGPDIDVLNIKKCFNHRFSPFHIPLYWFIVFCVVIFVTSLANNTIAAQFVIIIGVNVFVHFILDTITVGSGIQWFAPFSKKIYGFQIQKPINNFKTFFRTFIKNPSIYMEIMMWIATYGISRIVWHV
jgi:membrane-bound metal-dependent hydrolase YbcI (DUF457 family)